MEIRLDGNFPVEGSPRDVNFQKNKKILFEIVNDILEQKRKKRVGKKTCFIDFLRMLILSPIKKMNTNFLNFTLCFVVEANIPEDQIFSDVLTFLIGGFHTVGNLLTWTVHFISQDQNVQNKCVIRGVFLNLFPKNICGSEFTRKFPHDSRCIEKNAIHQTSHQRIIKKKHCSSVGCKV